MTLAPLALRRAGRALRHAFLSKGFALFGPGFSRDYLRFAWRAGRNWGNTSAGTLHILGCRVDYFNQSDALFLLHEIFSDAIYAFDPRTACPRIVDCGANIGLSVVFFKALYPDADIVAIEPSPQAFARLQETVESNHFSGVRLLNIAVAERDGDVSLYRGAGGSGSLVASIHPTGGAGEMVRAERLSQILSGGVDFLKLDVEGAEYGVMRDLVATGAIAHVREAVIECHEIADEPNGVDSLIRSLIASGMQVEAVVDRGASITLVRARRRP